MNILAMVWVSIFFFTCVSCVGATGEPSAGGPCEYKRYSGKATIVSIKPKEKQYDHRNEVYEVKFKFSSEEVR